MLLYFKVNLNLVFLFLIKCRVIWIKKKNKILIKINI